MSILSRPDVQSVIAWGDRAIQEALELDEYPITPEMGDIELNAASPTAWVGALQFKMLERLGLSDDELDLVFASME